MCSEINKLVGLQVIVEISEPWDVSVTVDQITIKAAIEKVKESAMLLRLHTPINIKGKLCNYFVATSRYEDDNILDLFQKERFIVAMTPLKVDNHEKTDPFELSTKHRGVGLIGTIVKKENS